MTQLDPRDWVSQVFGPIGGDVTVWSRSDDESSYEGTVRSIAIGATPNNGWLVLALTNSDGEETDDLASIPFDDIASIVRAKPAEPDEAADGGEQEPAGDVQPATDLGDESGRDVQVAALPLHVGNRIRFAVGTTDGEEVVDGTLIGIGRSPHPGHQRVVVARQEGADRAYNLRDELSVRVG